MTAYRSPGARPRKRYQAPRLRLLYRTWWAGPAWWLASLWWRAFGMRAWHRPDGVARRVPWARRAELMANPALMRAARNWPRPWWMRVPLLAWRTILASLDAGRPGGA